MKPTVHCRRMETLLTCQTKPVVEITIDYPELSGRIHKRVRDRLNGIFLSQAEELNVYAQTRFYTAACEKLKRCRQLGASFDFFICRQTFSVPYTDDEKISILWDTSLLSSPEKGLIRKATSTFCLKDGRRLLPTELIKPHYVEKICDEIIRKTADEDKMLDGWREGVRRFFNAEHVFVTPNGIGVFYPAATLMPFEEGVPTFLIDKSVYA